MKTDPECLFCRIVAGEIPATIVSEGPHTLAFRDVNPQAPVHVLVIPRQHFASLADVAADDAQLLAGLVNAATLVAELEGIDSTGWRLVANTGVHGGQTVGHVHLHVLGGRQHSWPPG